MRVRLWIYCAKIQVAKEEGDADDARVRFQQDQPPSATSLSLSPPPLTSVPRGEARIGGRGPLVRRPELRDWVLIMLLPMLGWRELTCMPLVVVVVPLWCCRVRMRGGGQRG